MTKAPTLLACFLLLPSLGFSQQERHRHHDDNHKAEKEAFLGIATGPVHESLRAQLNIDRGVGLVVHHVHSDSPAAEKLETHDILTRINDQILVNQDQLAVLVRNAGIGTNVDVTFLRRGAEQTASVTLGEREVREMRPLFQFGDGRGFHAEDLDHLERAQRGIHEAMERVQREMSEARERAEDQRRRMEEERERDEHRHREREERGRPGDSRDEGDREERNRDSHDDDDHGEEAEERESQRGEQKPRGEVL